MEKGSSLTVLFGEELWLTFPNKTHQWASGDFRKVVALGQDKDV